jgi:Ca2+-transporting ATPase
MTTVHHLGQFDSTVLAGLEIGSHRYVAFTKGSVDGLLGIASHVWVNGQAQRMDDQFKVRIEAANERLAKKGMRVLGVAFRLLDQIPEVIQTDLEQNLTFIGLFGMIDPPRAEVKDAVAITKSAGIRTMMITGDHPLTAAEIARQLGITETGRVLTGAEIENLSFDELKNVVDEVQVFARVSPEHKLKIVQALQERGHIVSMTGDGVNDAPALKRADIGVAMGITGTDVSKEAADMVLLDDNFATIVSAVKEGRVIYDNIRKFVKYILATNSGEIWLMLMAPFFGMPLPLLPLQILWMNLVTDGLPALALGIEPPEGDVMSRPPVKPGENIFARGLGRHVLWVGLLMGILSIGVGYWYWSHNNPIWQTMLFTTLTLSQMAHVMAIRSEKQSLFKIGVMSNRPMLGAVSLTFVLQLALIYVPFLQNFFQTMALPAMELGITIAVSAVVFWAVELEKWFSRRSGTGARAVA